MTVRKYPITSVKHGDGFVPAVLICCGEPGCTAAASMKATGRSGPAPEFAERFFRRQGWELGRKPSDDRCPDHTKKAKRNAAEHKETADMPTNKTPAVAEPPRQLGRDEQRIIHAYLQGVYIDEVGYSVGWTDQTVASNLNVPVAWVSEVREQFFGDAGSNPEIDNFVVQAKTLAGVQEILEHDLQVTVQALSSLQERMRKVREDITTLNTTAARIDAAINKKGKR